MFLAHNLPKGKLIDIMSIAYVYENMYCSTLSAVVGSKLIWEMEIMYIMIYAKGLKAKVNMGGRKKRLLKEPSLSIEPYYTVVPSSNA